MRWRIPFAILVIALASCGGSSPEGISDGAARSDGPAASGAGGSGTGGRTGTGGATGPGGALGTGGASGAGGTVGTGGSATSDAGPDAVPGDAISTLGDAAAVDGTTNRDLAGPQPHTVKDPYFTTTEESDGMHAWFLPWADRSAGPTDMAGLNSSQEILPLTIGSDGHLYRNGARYRLFGMNHFAGCSPSREIADLLAGRLAKFGFNAIRFQGCDAFFGWPSSRPLIDYATGNGDTLDKDLLDRFDYLISAMRKRGIYLEIPLLTTRRFLPGDSGDAANPLPVPPLVAGEEWSMDDMHRNQMLGFVLDPVVAAQQRYARNLLGHVNPYTGLALGKDPAVALVEIVNESGILHYWVWGRLDTLDSRILAELRRKWNAWLLAKYSTTAATEIAWGGTPAPAELLGNPSFSPTLAPWGLNVTSPAAATATTEPNADGASSALRIDITTAGAESWHVKLAQPGLTLIPGKSYRISFRAKASIARAFAFDISKNAAPWTTYTPWQESALGTTWQDHALSFVAGDEVADPAGAAFGINVGPATGTIWISRPSITTGGPALQAGETLEAGTAPLVPRTSGRAFSKPALLDYIRFLRDCEASYFKRMTDFLKKDLGVTAHLVGTQIINSLPTVQAAMDIIDTHSYWDNTQFPGKAFDRANWLIDNKSAVYSPPGVLDEIAAAHVAGKPFITTEASHGAPNQYAGEGALLTAAYGSLQDLDAFFQHQWGSGATYEANAMLEWFDLDHHPPKLASLPLVARLFRSFDISPAKKTFTVAMDPERELAALLDRGEAWRLMDASKRGFPMAAATISRVEMNVASSAVDSAWPDVSTMTKFASDTGELSWDKTAGLVTINSARTRAVVGFSGDQTFSLGGPSVDCALASGPCVTFKPGKTLTGHSTIALHLTEGDSFTTGAGRALLSATGDVRNTAMQWNQAKTSLGANWGHGPTRVEVIPASVTLPRAASEVAVFALDGRGQRIASVPVTGTSIATFAIGGSVPTLWYELVLGVAPAAGEGNHVLDACGAYCAGVAASLPTCYASTNDCLTDCATWTGETLGGRCDCTAEVDAVFACEKTHATRICGRLSQDVPPSNTCLPAFMQAFKCAGKVAPCAAVLAEESVDDFEDGELRASHPTFSSWTLSTDTSTTVTPKPFVTSAHGAGGSAQAAHLTASMPTGGYANLVLSSAQTAGVDLSGHVGIAFSARGVGRLRVGLPTTDLDAAANYDPHGMTFLLTPTWRRHVIRFDDLDFAQGGWGAKAAFASSKVSRLVFGNADSGSLDFWIDDVVLLKTN